MKIARRDALGAIAASAAGAALPAMAQGQATLRFGLAPYLSPALLLTAFRPLREHLERALAQPVEMYTARDFRTLADAVRRTEYDVALLPAHMARIAVADWGWTPLARTVVSTEVVVLVRDDGPVKSPIDLRRRRVGMLDLMSLSSAVGVQWLREQGQTVIEDVEIVTVPSVNSALIALARDDVAAVVAVASQLLDLKPEVAGGRRTLAHLADIPGPWHVGRPGVPAATVARWRDALLAFAPDLKRLPTAPNSRLTPLSVADTQAVEAYAAHLRVQLAQAR